MEPIRFKGSPQALTALAADEIEVGLLAYSTLAFAIDNAGILCQVLQSHGLRPLHHSHIGGVFETETEITQLLDTLGPDIIGFGPDTGHLQWAGINPATLITRYADRIGGIHIKDLYPDYLNPTTPTIINPKHTNRLTSRGSFKYIIPISTIPVVPSPVQTAYTVPTASFRLASAMNPKLASITTKVPTITGQFFPQFLNPFENLNPKGQHISHAAASKRKIQAMRST